ncbi:MAG: L,D-transpeptidase [Verrucomicrobia bacterium]|nr:L,D-transpeptidase [Verrucomicrobiota bacterium]
MLTCRKLGIQPSQYLLIAHPSIQRLDIFLGRIPRSSLTTGSYAFLERFIVSTSRFGPGQKKGSNSTPLGLHRIKRKIGAGHPIGTTFKGRKPTGFTWQGQPDAPIAHRIMWLEGVQSGLNAGGDIDTYSRYIYIHGVGNETTLGRPASRGCIHMAAADIIPLYDRLPTGTLVWIQ